MLNMQLKIFKRTFSKEIMDYNLWVGINKFKIVKSILFIKLDDTEFNQYVEIVKEEAKLEDDNLVYSVLPTIDKMLNHRKIS